MRPCFSATHRRCWHRRRRWASELGAAQTSTVRADEALPFAAVGIDADLICVDERLTPRDGVAAILRYAPRTSAAG